MKRPLGTLAALAILLITLAVALAAPHNRIVIDGDDIGDRFGFSVSGAGDVNADGYDDYIVGSYWDDDGGANAGRARIYSGKDGKVLYTFDGDAAGDEFGVSVSDAGDVNADGYADVVVGARNDDNNGTDSGSARVFSGKDGKTLYTFDGDGAVDRFGGCVSGAGDVNNDGYDDIIVGAHLDDNSGTDGGMARVLSGKDGKTLHTFNAVSANDRFGISVSGAGDVNSDGYDDVIVGAHFDDDYGSNSGSARVFSGKDGTTLYSVYGNSVTDQLGRAVSDAGDVNQDGYDDFLVSAMLDDYNGTDSGTVYLYSGRDGKVLYTW